MHYIVAKLLNGKEDELVTTDDVKVANNIANAVNRIGAWNGDLFAVWSRVERPNPEEAATLVASTSPVLIASIGGWGAPDWHAPMWSRRRVLATATRLLYTDRLSVDGLLDRRYAFEDAPEAYRWLDHNPQGAVKVALDYRLAGSA